MAADAGVFGDQGAPHGFQRQDQFADHHEEFANASERRPIPADYQTLLKTWNWSAFFYQVLAYGLSFVGIVSGIGVTYFVGGGKGLEYAATYATALGFLGAVCAAVSGVLRPMQIGNRYRNAWRLLNVSRLRYQSDPSMSPMHLWETVARCELIIGDFELNGAEGRTAPEDRPRNRKTKNALKLFETLLEWHRDTPRETLLQLLSGQPDFATMTELTQPALLVLFAQRSATAAAMASASVDAHR
jgi:hypothetical protein